MEMTKSLFFFLSLVLCMCTAAQQNKMQEGKYNNIFSTLDAVILVKKSKKRQNVNFVCMHSTMLYVVSKNTLVCTAAYNTMLALLNQSVIKQDTRV